ncbi:hypothetical protein CRM22_008250 [Opisthorchis felineus]|uniref:Uncharacterized protein n=1 Tax=Opisthorchis felineus TaxID=147828 RepID=A0A4S2LCI6_OPIFE|nr:hypothetical protein CRM22_008250 [Opisthorchis felineus]
MSLPRAIDWIAQYMQYTCIPNDPYIENNTAVQLGGYWITVWIIFLTILAYINCLCSFSVRSCRSRNSFASTCVVSVAVSVVRNLQPSEKHRKNRKKADRPEPHTGAQSSCNANRCLDKLNPNFLILYVISCCLLSCHAFQSVDGKPLPGPSERQRAYRYPSYGGAAPPTRILMPPLDLGFRGQISSEEKHTRQNNLASNYQSDESAGHRWTPEAYQYAERPQQPQSGYGRFAVDRPQSEGSHQQPAKVSQYPYSNGYAQDQWSPNNGYEPNQYPVQYLQSRDPSAMLGPVAQPNGQYMGTKPTRYSGPMQQTNMRQNMLYQPPYPMPGENMNGPVAFAPSTPNRNPYTSYGQPRPPPWYGAYGQQPPMPAYHAYDNMALYPRLDASNIQRSPTQYGPTNVLGHQSNYDVVTEDEIERRLKEYNDYLASNNKNKEPATGSKNTPEHHDNGLRLRGSQSHEKVLREFNKIASQFSLNGVDALFDEIDLNRFWTYRNSGDRFCPFLSNFRAVKSLDALSGNKDHFQRGTSVLLAKRMA